MKFDIEEELKKLPTNPGVYIMHDKNNKIIYVGKAINLKRRVTSYFRKTNKTKRIQNMVELINHFEYIICSSEQEALILECNLIKKNMPKFNVLLKDDKTYPYIKINVKADFPDIYITRRILNDGAKYYGPYPNGGSAKEMIDFIKSKFKIRQCKNFKYKDRPCLNYNIKKCLAPCMGYISKDEYKKMIENITDMLDGKTKDIEKELKFEMENASKNLDFEKAANLRDELIAVERISQKQIVSNISANDIDVIGLARNDDCTKICIEIFYIRNSKMVGKDNFFFKDMQDEKDANIICEFIKRFYANRKFFPNKIMIQEELDEKELIENWLTSMSERKVEIKTPQKGEKMKLVEMAEKNAKVTLDNLEKASKNLMLEIKQKLELENLPRRIESYDISNISGDFIVGAMCVMINGEIKKNMSRKFKIKTIFKQDDPKCMEEVVTRRLRHSVKIVIDKNTNEKKIETKSNYNDFDENKFLKLDKEIQEKYGKDSGFGGLPNLIFADGGITQIRAIKKSLKNIENETGIKLNIGVYGMIKNDKHQTRALISEDRKEIEISEELFNLITNFQNTVHDTVITYHRSLRDKSMTKSELDNIKGIGDSKKRELIKNYGSIEKIKNTTINELTKIKGITESLATEILENLNKKC